MQLLQVSETLWNKNCLEVQALETCLPFWDMSMSRTPCFDTVLVAKAGSYPQKGNETYVEVRF